MPQCDRSRRRGSDEQGPRIVHIELSSQEGEKLEGSTRNFGAGASDDDGRTAWPECTETSPLRYPTGTASRVNKGARHQTAA